MFVGKVRTITRPVTLVLLFLKVVYLYINMHETKPRNSGKVNGNI